MQLLEASSSQPPSQTPPNEPISEDSDKLFLFPISPSSSKPVFNISLHNPSVGMHPIKKIILFLKHFTYSEDREITLVSVTSDSTNHSVPYNMRVMGMVRPQPNQNTNQSPTSTLSWMKYDITDIVINDFNSHRESFIQVESEKNVKIYKSFITVEYDYGNVSKTHVVVKYDLFCCLFFISFTQNLTCLHLSRRYVLRLMFNFDSTFTCLHCISRIVVHKHLKAKNKFVVTPIASLFKKAYFKLFLNLFTFKTKL